jgi:hypothetical protein
MKIKYTLPLKLKACLPCFLQTTVCISSIETEIESLNLIGITAVLAAVELVVLEKEEEEVATATAGSAQSDSLLSSS